ncbi:MAG TPA: TadE family protein [Gammaproteobacteria bacterium]|nr:TadE family protein [Gammaproteobacteria bacterium]
MKRLHLQTGQSMTEFVIVAPVMFLLVFGAMQFGLIYHAKTTLNYATFEAARSAAVNHAVKAAAESGLARGLAPLYTHEDSVSAVQAGRRQVRDDIAAGYAEIERLSPPASAFDDYGQGSAGDRNIPNDNLMYRDPAPGKNSGLSIQDANLLKLRVTYCYPLYVPFANKVIVTLMSFAPSSSCEECVGPPAPGSLAKKCLDDDRLPIVSQAIVRMQSEASEAW